MDIPQNLMYTEKHEWIRQEGDEAFVGITEYAQVELGDIVFVEIETEGEALSKGNAFGTIEAVKTVSDLFMPVSGTVLEINSRLQDEPELVNKDPYGEGWMIRISINKPVDMNELLTPDQYKGLISS